MVQLRIKMIECANVPTVTHYNRNSLLFLSETPSLRRYVRFHRMVIE